MRDMPTMEQGSKKLYITCGRADDFAVCGGTLLVIQLDVNDTLNYFKASRNYLKSGNSLKQRTMLYSSQSYGLARRHIDGAVYVSHQPHL
ncbi:hypothetical protein Plhal304r1_c029g0096691 [Plasmopara halstedii]